MGVTATQLAYRALRDLGCLRPGQTTSTDVISDVLQAINDRIDVSQLNPLLKYAFRPDIYNLTAGKQTYTIGPVAADLTATRPTAIQAANIIITTVSPAVRYPLYLANVDEWAALRVRAIASAIPLELYYDLGFDATSGFGTLNLWPGPIAGLQLELFTWQQLQTFPDTVTSLTWPLGYVTWLRKQVAVDIAPMMEIYVKLAKLTRPRAGRVDDLKEQARLALADIESYNAPEPKLTIDGGFRGGRVHGGAFNYAIGEQRGN